MKKGKWTKIALTAVLSLGTLTAFSTPLSAHTTEKSTSSDGGHYSGIPFDSSVVNEDRLVKALKKQGKIKKNANEAETQKALKNYLKKKEESAMKQSASTLTEEPEFLKEYKQEVHNKLAKKKKLKKHKGKESNQVKPVKKEKYKGDVRNDKVLVLLVDFKDYKHNSIKKEETDMYYDKYDQQHYQDMLFGKNGYIGPDGKRKVSMKQYYEKQSGGSYTVSGTVAGWYTAKHEAAYYGGNVPDDSGSDGRPRELVKEALEAAAKDPNIDLSEYDQWDRYDIDGDGVYNEPDGIIDHLMVVHAGVGEEAGGGQLGADAIWSHRWSLGDVFEIPDTESEVGQGGKLGALDYTIEPEDGAAGVFTHEFGHDLGLPDEYDTQYTGRGEPVSYWSIMSSGSWAGKVPGTEPTGFSPYAKEMLQNLHGGNWLSGQTIDGKTLKKSKTVLIDEAATKGTNHDAVRVDLPDKEIVVTTPAQGKYSYFSGTGDNLNATMTTTGIDLSKGSKAELTFKAWYDIEEDYDYAYVEVRETGTDQWKTIAGNITNDRNEAGANEGNGIDGKSDGWVDAAFDLSAYAGKKIDLQFRYTTDAGYSLPGLFVDDLNITADGTKVWSDDAEGTSTFTFNGFSKSNGKQYAAQYYLLEWRSYADVDKGLKHIKRGASLMSYNNGLVVWYVDQSYSDNWVGKHPGNGFLGVVDADQQVLKWSDGSNAATGFQVHDAAFSLNPSTKLNIDYTATTGLTLQDRYIRPARTFSDKKNYVNPNNPDAGRDVPTYGLSFKVVGQSKDRSVGKVLISKSN
ncbi:immune inhibitor A [Bacillus safensis]|uniref:immune inhibitor A domain-containing protein n=1 Tax=Bacillus safensis TaxID=561879 RepID=UPI00155FC32E|nr:immune inhibitor A domain-containing protein [Bacillus safensis]NRF04824.1 immune inhibitor A [Bacillus safensis]